MIEGISSALQIINKAMSWMTPAQKVKRIRIKIEKLKEEKRSLMSGKCSGSKAKRVIKLSKKIADLELYLRSR